MKNMERGLAGLVVFRLAPVLLSLDGTSGCLLTGAWTAKLCVSDIVRGAICEALTHRFVKGLLPWLDWMHEAISMAVARSLGSSQSAVRPTSDEASSDRGSETPGGGAPSRVQLVGLYADIRYSLQSCLTEIYEAKHAAGDFANQMHYTFEPSACHTRSAKPAQKHCSDKSHLKPGLSDGCLKATSESRCPCNQPTPHANLVQDRWMDNGFFLLPASLKMFSDFLEPLTNRCLIVSSCSRPKKHFPLTEPLPAGMRQTCCGPW